MRRRTTKLIQSLEEKLGNHTGESGSFFFVGDGDHWELNGKTYTEEERDAFINTLSPRAKVILFTENKTNPIDEPIID